MSSYMPYEVSMCLNLLCQKSESRLGFQKVLWVLFRTPHVSHVHPQCKRKVAVETLQGFLKHSDSFSSTNFRCTSFSILNSMIKVRNEKKVHEISWHAFEQKDQKGRWLWPSFVLTHSLASSWFWKFTKAHRRPCPSVSDLRPSESGS